MIGLRPKAIGRYLKRPRLLNRLPTEAGHVVWLEAPYGYGKSVLAAQWADHLEAQGWRVLWLSLGGATARTAIARSLELPGGAPWGVVLETLWEETTLLVLEDLQGDEELSPLLKHAQGLVLLASRSELFDPELPRLVTAGRLTRLRATELALTQAEAEALFPDQPTARRLWERTQGWPLPLHFSSITGEEPDRKTLIEGMRTSLSEEAWAEAMLMAGLSYLPTQAAGGATEELAGAGFVQPIEDGYRLHPLVADALAAFYPEAMRSVARRKAVRLPPILRGAVFEKLAMGAELDALLEQEHTPPLASLDADAVVRWDRLAPAPGGRNRRLAVARAIGHLGRDRESAEMLGELAEELAPEAPDKALAAFGNAAYRMATLDAARAVEYAGAGLSLAQRAAADVQAAFYHNISWAFYRAGQADAAQAHIEQALALFSKDNPHRLSSLHARAFMGWERRGDLDGLMAAFREMLSYTESAAPAVHTDLQLELGRFTLLLGDVAGALAHLQKGRDFPHAPPPKVLEAQCEIAAITQDLSELSRLQVEAARWEDARLAGLVAARWARVLRLQGRTEQALGIVGEASGFDATVERALLLGGEGKRDEALAVLGEPPADREEKLAWHAARFQVAAEGPDLDALLELTLAQERVLPGLLPLTVLPRDRPELARAYPIESVLEARWPQAAALRLDEVPTLELKVMGAFGATVLGKEVKLVGRQRELVALLLLRLDRDAIGEALWPESSAESVRNNLHVNLNTLRKLFEPWGVSTYLTEEGLSRTRSDLWELETALERRDGDRALRLYRPPLCPGVDLPLLDDARAELHERVLGLLTSLAETAPAELRLAYLERALELDPLNEEVLQQYLRQLVSRGRKQEAARRYRSFAELLADEMGLEPLPETRKLIL